MKPAKILIILTLLLYVFTARAQHHSLTILGGFNAANMSASHEGSAAIEDSYKMKMAFHAGGLFDYVLTKDRHKELSIESGILFDAKGVKQDQTYVEAAWNLYYADIPLYFKYAKKLRSRDKIYGGVGPYVGVGIFGKHEDSYNVGDESGSTSESIKWGTDPKEHDFKRLDYGVSAKIGYYAYSGLNISASYDYGIPNITVAEDWPEFKHRVIRVSIGYSFRFEN